MAEQKKDNQLQVILKEQNVPKTQAEQLVAAFGGPFEEAGAILATYQDIKVTDVNDAEGMKKARESRLALKAARTTIERNRKQLKEDINKTGRAIDSVARYLKEAIAPAEEYLQLQEDYAKIVAKQQHDEMIANRLEQLAMRGASPALYNYDGMSNAEFEQLLKDIDAEQERKVEEARKAAAEEAKRQEAEREAQAQRDLEAKRLRAVNALGFAVRDDGSVWRGSFDATPAGLNWPSIVTMSEKGFDKTVDGMVKAADKYDADQAAARKAEAERQAKITERVNWLSSLGAVFNGTDYRLASKQPGGEGAIVTKAEVENDSDEQFAKALQLVENVSKANDKYDSEREAQAKADREKAERLEQEKRDREAADAKAKADAEAAEKAALLAPDKTKLLSLADGLEMVRSTKLPALKTKQAQDVVNDVDAELTRLVANIRAKADRLK